MSAQDYYYTHFYLFKNIFSFTVPKNGVISYKSIKLNDTVELYSTHNITYINSNINFISYNLLFPTAAVPPGVKFCLVRKTKLFFANVPLTSSNWHFPAV